MSITTDRPIRRRGKIPPGLEGTMKVGAEVDSVVNQLLYEHRISQRALAKYLGTSSQTVCLSVNRRQPRSRQWWQKVAKALCVPVSSIMDPDGYAKLVDE